MKLKTRKAAAKRIRFTATGKAKFQHAGRRHNTGFRKNKNMQKLRGAGYLTPAFAKHLEGCLPYGN